MADLDIVTGAVLGIFVADLVIRVTHLSVEVSGIFQQSVSTPV